MRVRCFKYIFYAMTNEKKADLKFHRILKEFKNGKLKSNGKRVKDKKQALAIAFSEARQYDNKYENGKKIDNVTNAIFEDAWEKYITQLHNSEIPKTTSFDKWLITTNDGNKYYKRLAEIGTSEANLTIEPQMNKRGAKLVGPSHADGGIAGYVRETGQPIEVEGDELIITKGVGKIRQHITCSGQPEAIASKLNELGGGDKISNQKEATCHLKKEIMERGKKISSHVIEQKIKREQQLKNSNKMEYGAKIEIVPTDIILKINDSKEFDIVKFLTKRSYSHLKVFKTKDICVYIGQPLEMENFSNFLDKYGIYYTEFDNEEEFSNWLENQLPARIKNKLQNN